MLQCNKDLVALRCAPYWNSSNVNPIEEQQSEGAQQPNSIVMQHTSFGDGEGVEESSTGSLGNIFPKYISNISNQNLHFRSGLQKVALSISSS